MRCRFDVIFFTLIAPRRLKISRYTRNSILKIVFTMVGHPKMPREVRNGRFLQIAPIWTVTAKFRQMASVKIWKNAVFRFGGSPRSFWHTSCSGLFLRESRLPQKCTVVSLNDRIFSYVHLKLVMVMIASAILHNFNFSLDSLLQAMLMPIYVRICALFTYLSDYQIWFICLCLGRKCDAII